MATYVMSDIHGQLNSFHSMIDKIGLDKEKDTLYLLGDYVDWGQDGVGVIQQIMKMQKDGYSIKCLMGNHEKMMLGLKRYARLGCLRLDDLAEFYTE